jgi:DNA-binding response OmpR family regulator
MRSPFKQGKYIFGHKFATIFFDLMNAMYKVLLVDDDPDLLEMVVMALSKQGYAISSISNGRTFFDVIHSFKPDLILLDIFLGDADGRTLCQQLKQATDQKDIPVILYSAGNIPRYTIENSLADDFVTKPFDIKQLAEKIQSMLVA